MEIVLSDCFKETQNQNCNQPLSTKHTTASSSDVKRMIEIAKVLFFKNTDIEGI